MKDVYFWRRCHVRLWERSFCAVHVVVSPFLPDHLSSPSVCFPVDVCLEIDARPSGANIYFNSLIFFFYTPSISLKYSHSMRSVKLWDELHNQQQIPPYLPVWYVWTYFHMLWTVPDSRSQQQPTAGKHWWHEGISDLEQSSAIPCLLPLYNLSTCHFPPMTPPAYASKVWA